MYISVCKNQSVLNDVGDCRRENPAQPTHPMWGVAPVAFQLCPTETFAVAIAAHAVESLVIATKSLAGNTGY